MIKFAVDHTNIYYFNFILAGIIKFKLAIDDNEVSDFCSMLCGGGEL